MTKPNFEFRTLDTVLTPAEVADRASQMAMIHFKKDEAESEAKAEASAAKEKIKELGARLHELSRAVRTGIEPRDVRCEFRRNDEAGTIETYRTDTGEQVSVREMYPNEKQTRLFEIDGGKDEAAPAKKGRGK